jgi:hypothetical protein
MNLELAQIIALITHGNEYLSSPGKDVLELYPWHSTFQFVSNVSFREEKSTGGTSRNSQIIVNVTHTWFSHLEAEGVKYLKLDLLNLDMLPSPYATSILTAGGAWVIQTDMGKCWQAKWSLQKEGHPQAGIWKVEYRESDNSPVITNFLDIETAYSVLKNSLLDAQDFSLRWKFGWDKWFAEAISILQSPSPIQPYYADLLPHGFENIRVRQLLAGALKAWVFGGLGSWNDMYIANSSQENEYQRISKSLYQAVIQSVGAVVSATAGNRLLELHPLI